MRFSSRGSILSIMPLKRQSFTFCPRRSSDAEVRTENRVCHAQQSSYIYIVVGCAFISCTHMKHRHTECSRESRASNQRTEPRDKKCAIVFENANPQLSVEFEQRVALAGHLDRVRAWSLQPTSSVQFQLFRMCVARIMFAGRTLNTVR